MDCVLTLAYDRIDGVVDFFSDFVFFFSSRRRHTRSVSAFLLNRSSDLNDVWASGYDVDGTDQTSLGQFSGRVQQTYKHSVPRFRSEERFSRNAETDLVCRLLLEKKK